MNSRKPNCYSELVYQLERTGMKSNRALNKARIYCDRYDAYEDTVTCAVRKPRNVYERIMQMVNTKTAWTLQDYASDITKRTGVVYTVSDISKLMDNLAARGCACFCIINGTHVFGRALKERYE